MFYIIDHFRSLRRALYAGSNWVPYGHVKEP